MSPTAYVSNGSAWVQSGLSGKVRHDGADISFAPPATGPLYESVSYSPLVGTNETDGGATYAMGLRFSLGVAKPCYGVRWRVPDTVAGEAPDDGYVARLWRIVGEVPVASKVFNPVGSEGADLDILFDTPYNVLTGEYWIAAVLTRRYVYAPRSAFPELLSPSGNIHADEGKLGFSAGINTFPSSTQNTYYGVRPLIGV